MRFACVLLGVLLLAGCASRSTVDIAPEITQPKIEFSAQPRCLQLLGVGDIMLGGTAVPVLQREGYDYPFSALSQELEAADLAIGNLETALTHAGEPADKKYTFRNPPELVLPALKGAGFDLVGLANNHTMDYGVAGLRDTLAALQVHGLAAVGAGESLAAARAPVVLDAAGQKVGFLAYSLTFPQEFWAGGDAAGTAYGKEQHIREDVEQLSRVADVVVVQFHWGREGTTELRDYQICLGRAAIEAGAKVVFGHHPHILQAVESYRDGVIYYSLGNFAFGSYSNRVQTGGVGKVELCEGQIESFALKMIDVNNYRVHFRPVQAEGDLLAKAQRQIMELSRELGTELLESAEGLVSVPPAVGQMGNEL